MPVPQVPKRLGLLLTAVAMLGAGPTIGAASATTGAISGSAYEDANRNGARDAGESPWSNQQIYLFDSSGRNVAVQWTDASGDYTFPGLADGQYEVAYASSSWAPLKMDWTPTTTGAWQPTRSVNLVSQATVDFGWRRIVRAADLDHPVSSYTAPNGLTVQLYNDVVAPEEVAQLVARGSLVGQEAASTTIRLDGAQYTATGSSYAGGAGSYSGYRAIVTIDWLTWLSAGENSLFHEYGHAWSGYFSVMVQQDPALNGYLEARGLAGDARVDGSYGWSRWELIAEDYRQLFGTPLAQAGAQANGELAPASAVPGLREYLAGAFRQAPSTTPPPPVLTAPLTVTGVGVNPRPVTKSGTVGYTLNRAANATVAIRTASGSLVRTLVTNKAQDAGAQALTWDRKDARGRRVAAGTYNVTVSAAAGEATASASADFPVA